MVIEKSQEIQGYRTKDMNMEKYKFDENNGLWYELQGDYYLPCLKLPEEEQAYIAEREGVTEQLKATDSMEWVRKMNSIRYRAVEITNSELIYA